MFIDSLEEHIPVELPPVEEHTLWEERTPLNQIKLFKPTHWELTYYTPWEYAPPTDFDSWEEYSSAELTPQEEHTSAGLL